MAEDNGTNGIATGVRGAATTLQGAVPGEVTRVFDALQNSVSGLTSAIKGNTDIIGRSVEATKKGLEDLGGIVEAELAQSPVVFALYNIMKGTVTDSIDTVKRALGLAESLTEETTAEPVGETPAVEIEQPDAPHEVVIIGSEIPLYAESPTIEEQREQDRDEKQLIKSIAENNKLLKERFSLEKKQKRPIGIDMGGLTGFGRMAGAVAIGSLFASFLKQGFKFIFSKALFIPVITGLYQGVIDLFDAWQEGKPILEILSEGLYGFIEGATFGLFSRESIKEFVSKAKNFLVTEWNLTVDGVMALGRIVKEKTLNAWTAIKDWAVSEWNATVEGVKNIGATIKDYFLTGIGFIKDEATALMDRTMKAFSEAGTVIKDFFSGVWNKAMEKIDSAAIVLEGVRETVVDFVGGIMDRIKDAFSVAIDSIKNIKDDLILWVNENTKKFFGGLFEDEAEAIRKRREDELKQKLENSEKGAAINTMMDTATADYKRAEREGVAGAGGLVNAQNVSVQRTGDQITLTQEAQTKHHEYSSAMQNGHNLAFAR